MIDQALRCSAIGSPATVRRGSTRFIARTGADELIMTSQIFDHAARLRSFEIASEVRSARQRADTGQTGQTRV